MSVIRFVLLVVVASLGMPANAVPGLMTYSGRLVNAAGIPVTRTTTQALVLDTEFVDLVGLSSSRENQWIYGTS